MGFFGGAISSPKRTSGSGLPKFKHSLETKEKRSKSAADARVKKRWAKEAREQKAKERERQKKERATKRFVDKEMRRYHAIQRRTKKRRHVGSGGGLHFYK